MAVLVRADSGALPAAVETLLPVVVGFAVTGAMAASVILGAGVSRRWPRRAVTVACIAGVIATVPSDVWSGRQWPRHRLDWFDAQTMLTVAVRALPLVGIVLLIKLLYDYSSSVTPPPTSVRRLLGLGFAGLVFFVADDTIFYIPLAWAAGVAISAVFLLPRTKSTADDGARSRLPDLLRSVVDLQSLRRARTQLRRSGLAKVGAGELTASDYQERLSDLDARMVTMSEDAVVHLGVPTGSLETPPLDHVPLDGRWGSRSAACS
jgi:hypothetical protein